MPFVTEDLWQRLPQRPGAPPSIMLASYPQPQQDWQDAEVEQGMDLALAIVAKLRNTRTGGAPAHCGSFVQKKSEQLTAVAPCTGYGLTPRQQPPVHVSCSDERRQRALEQVAGEAAACALVLLRLLRAET